jgi:phosphatidylglycerol---prolipoprotein diacylglyceryl transferase
MPGRWLYTLFMALAMVVYFAIRRLLPLPADVARLTIRQRIVLGWSAFLGAAFGSKLPFALTQTAWFADGKTIITGLAGAYLAVEISKRLLGIHIKTGDSYAVPLAAAIAVGRLGCFFNGCCYGTPSDLPWAMDLLGDGVFRHPTQLYESLFHFGMAIVLWRMSARDLCRTHRLQVYLIAYCGYRFLTEFIRPEPRGWLDLTFYQWASILFAAALAGQWLWERRTERIRDEAMDAFPYQLKQETP